MDLILEVGMRGEEERCDGLFGYVKLERRVPAEQPLRAIRVLVDEIPAALLGGFRGAPFAHRLRLDRAGEAVAGSSGAGLPHHPLGAPADGTAGL